MKGQTHGRAADAARAWLRGLCNRRRRLWVTQKEFDNLLEYSRSIPTGKTIGKQWKRRCVNDQWLLGEYYDINSETEIGIRYTPLYNIGDIEKDRDQLAESLLSLNFFKRSAAKKLARNLLSR